MNAHTHKRGSTGWLLIIAVGILSCLIMGLVMVWVNIERMDTSYFINILQVDVRDRQSHKAKLEVEREHLLSPYELGRKAEALGMRQPKPGQIRRMDEK